MSGFDLFGGGIKSIQSGTTLINSTIVDVPIDEINLSKSILLFFIRIPNATVSIANVAVSGYLSNQNNIKFEIANAYNTPTVEWYVLEFDAVKSLQTGIKEVSTATETVTISNVDVSKSIVIVNYKSGDSSTTIPLFLITGKLTNATTLTLNQAGNRNKTVYWQVIEVK